MIDPKTVNLIVDGTRVNGVRFLSFDCELTDEPVAVEPLPGTLEWEIKCTLKVNAWHRLLRVLQGDDRRKQERDCLRLWLAYWWRVIA